MKFDFVFKKTTKENEKIIEFAKGRLGKLSKFEIKPTNAHFVFSTQRHEHNVEITVNGFPLTFRAQAKGEDFYEALDAALAKLERQMAKQKHKVKYHKKPELAAFGRVNENQGSQTRNHFMRKAG